ncbi:retrovirus-related pol polyprotein from transposon TNT 1-94 [Tanacetum coccineum]
MAPWYVGPFEIVERVGPVAYRLKLPQELSCVHDTFHVSNLKKCLAEPDVQVPLDEIEIDENLRFIEEPIEIVERDVKKLKRRRIPLVKVRWNSRQGAEYTWEREDQFRKKYPNLFPKSVLSSTPQGYHSAAYQILGVLQVVQRQLAKLNATNVEGRVTLQEIVSQRLPFHHTHHPFKTTLIKAKLAHLSSGASTSKSSLVKNKDLITEAYEWDEEDVSSNDNETVEVKVLMALADDESGAVGKESVRNDEWNKEINLVLKNRDLVQELNTCKERLLVLKQAKLDFLTMYHVNTEILKENQNLRKELKELTTVTETWLNTSNKLFEVEGFNLSNHDTGRIIPSESQVKVTDSSVNVTDYDSADESAVYSTLLPPLSTNYENYTLVVVDEYLRNSILVNFCNEKGISQNFSSPYTPEQNDVAERKNRTLIEAARTMLSGSVFLKQHLTEAIATACYTQNRCPIFIHNHKDHLGKFDEKADDGYFLGCSLVSKALWVFNTRRQQTKETYHVTFDESTEAIKFSKPLVDDITIAELERYSPDEYLHHFEPSQRYQVDSNVVVFIEPYERCEPTDTEADASLDQNDQADQNNQADQSDQTDQNNLNDQNDHPVQIDEILNDDQPEHSNHNNNEHIINNLPNTKDVHITEPLSSSTKDASALNVVLTI